MRLLLFSTLFGFGLAGALNAAEPAVSPLAGPLAPLKLPVPPSPVDRFKELLAMDQQARAVELSKKAPNYRRVIEERLKEFDGLTAEQRKVRLRLQQISWELLRVLPQAPTNRDIALSFIPEQDRKLVTERLKYWDQLSPDLQKAVLENEAMLSYFISGQVRSTTELTNRFVALPAPARTNLARSIKQWAELSPDQQKKIYDNFREVFGLDPQDRAKIMREASVEERQKMVKVLQFLRKMPAKQQQQCMDSLRKFTSMTSEERAQFLRNAERWQKMPEEDRNKWRTLVRAVPPLPPLPPGFGQNPQNRLPTNDP